jgi:PGF-CTERM protein
VRDRLLAVALATLVVASMAVGAVGGVAAAPATQDDEPATDEPLGDADDAYVTDDGDVILVYENDDTGAGTEVSYGLDVGESVFHALVVTNDTGSTNVTGDATAVLTPDRLAGNGSLTAPQPDAVESLTLDASATQTDENAEADFSLSTTLNDSETGVTGIVETADLSTRASLAPDTFEVNGSFDAQLTAPLGSPQEQSFSVTESDSGYTLTAAQNYTVSEFARDRWASREAAKRTLEAQYGSLADSLGGESTVTIEEYEFTNTTGPSDRARLDIAFTVEYAGIEEGLREQIVSSLADAEDVDLTEAEAEQVAEQLTELQVDELSASLDAGETSYEGEFAVRLSDYEGAIRAGLTVAEATEPPEAGPEAANPLGEVDFDRVRDTLDARGESGLVETYTLDASIESADAGTALDVAASYRTENWAAYREALAERNISVGSSELSLHAETDGDEITAEGTVTVEQDQLVRDTLDTLSNSTNETEDAEARRFIEAFRNADLRKARMDVSVTRDEVRIEAGAAFEDMAAFRDAFRETTGTDLNVASAVGRTQNGSTTSYVRVVGAVDGNASNVTEADVRALGPVTENTTVHLSGTYNRTFPEADVRGSYEYLGLEYSTPTEPTPTPSPGQPGFGVAAAATALVAAGLLAARRRRTQ